MPQNTPMKRQFTTIDGRTVMSNLPQHWGGNDWAITGVDNPLPVGNYVQTEAGVWIPQKGSDDGAADVRLTGRNVVKNVGNDVELITLVNAQSIAPGGRIDVGLDYQGEKYRILSFSIDQQPWSVSTNSIYRAIPDYRGEYSGIYPYIDNETNTYSTVHPKEVLFTGHAGINVLFKPESVEEVIEYVISYPNERIRVENLSEEVATLTVKLIRVGVGNYE